MGSYDNVICILGRQFWLWDLKRQTKHVWLNKQQLWREVTSDLVYHVEVNAFLIFKHV